MDGSVLKGKNMTIENDKNDEIEIFYYRIGVEKLKHTRVTKEKLETALKEADKKWVIFYKEQVPQQILPIFEKYSKRQKPLVGEDVIEKLQEVSSKICDLQTELSELEDTVDDLITKVQENE